MDVDRRRLDGRRYFFNIKSSNIMSRYKIQTPFHIEKAFEARKRAERRQLLLLRFFEVDMSTQCLIVFSQNKALSCLTLVFSSIVVLVALFTFQFDIFSRSLSHFHSSRYCFKLDKIIGKRIFLLQEKNKKNRTILPSYGGYFTPVFS